MSESEVINSFGLAPRAKSNLMALGVGGAGGNAVNHMYKLGVEKVTFMLCNTDRQALNRSDVEIKIQLGSGLGAGNNPGKGRKAALESIDEIVLRFEQEGTEMVFITAGMGGGTGTGAAPVIAKAARDKGILTVGIVTLPFSEEGEKRITQAYRGLEEMKKNVDSLVIIHNDNISKIYGTLPLSKAFAKADDIVASAARGIADLTNKARFVNVDLEDVRSVMVGGGMALMGTGTASGSDKVNRLTEAVLNSPLLNHKDIRGSKNILLNFSYLPDKMSLIEIRQVMDNIQRRVSKIKGERTNSANIIWGAGDDETLDEEVSLTLVVTGFETLDDAERAKRPDISIPVDKNDGCETILFRQAHMIDDLEKFLNTPAYIRRGVNMSYPTSGKPTTIAAKEGDIEPASHKSGDLFNN